MAKKRSLNSSIGKEIRLLRTEKGMSLKEFEAQDHSIDRHSLSRIERGEKLPTILTISKICAVLGVSLSEFFKRVENSIKT
jgi:transcriptional regulator with XRE-family HTH domain